MTDSHRKNQQAGFTLVEIMISIAILSLISLGTLTAMTTLASTHEKLSQTTDRVDEMRQVSQFLRHSLRQAQGAGGGTATSTSTWGGLFGNAQAGLLRAEPDEIIWTAPLDSIQGISGMTYIRLYREDDQLKLQFLPEYQGIPDMQEFAWDQAEEGYLLLPDVEEFTITYRAEVGGPWLDHVEAGTGLPQAIGLTISARGRYWPEIIVSPYGAAG